MAKKKNKNIKVRKEINWNVVFYSILALVFLALTYFVDWIFIVPVLFLMWLNQRELFGKTSEKPRPK
jgi:1,4-dihydroxy-2-naphthoate octaprenyltransferase